MSRPPRVIKLKGLKESGRLLAPGQTRALRSGYVVLKAGESVGWHSTKAREEVVLILSGKAKFSSGRSASFRANRNELIYVPAHTRHNVQNAGKQPLRYVYIVTPIP